jgi:hypothetical protein
MDKAPKIKTPYRDTQVREAMGVAQEQSFGVEVSPEIAAGFFGLGEGRLSPEELEDFSLFVGYAGKRLINTQVVNNIGHSKNWKSKSLKFLAEVGTEQNSIAFHDISHCVATIADGAPGNSVVPPFLAENTLINNKSVIGQEALALIWDDVFGSYPLLYYFLKPELRGQLRDAYAQKLKDRGEYNTDLSAFLDKIAHVADNVDPSRFDEVFDAYQRLVYITTQKVNEVMFVRENKSASTEQIDGMNQEYDRVVESLMEKPDQNLERVARTVFENHEKNPKILFDEFMRICGPLIGRLKKRKQNG